MRMVTACQNFSFFYCNYSNERRLKRYFWLGEEGVFASCFFRYVVLLLVFLTADRLSLSDSLLFTLCRISLLPHGKSGKKWMPIKQSQSLLINKGSLLKLKRNCHGATVFSSESKVLFEICKKHFSFSHANHRRTARCILPLPYRFCYPR